MKIAYLILAHNNFDHLNRLIGTLDDMDASFYIHLDKKCNVTYVSNNSKVNVIPQHFDIKWGGYSMIEATLALMNNALNNSSDADYFILISGVDYPIRPKSFLTNLLSKGKEYIDIIPGPIWHKPIERFNSYYFEFDRRAEKLFIPFREFERTLRLLKIRRKIPFQLYVGGQWFALTRNCISYILDTVKNEKLYAKYFKYTLVPDEVFFQTIIGNSPFRNNTANNLLYSDWDVPIPPAIIEERHIELLKNKIEFEDEYGKRYPYFARKFTDESADVIHKIDEELRKEE